MSAGTTGDISAAPSAEIYDTDRFGELYYASRDIPTQNLGLAGRYLTSVFKKICIPALHGSTCIQIFVYCGGEWDYEYRRTAKALPVSVDLVVMGTPDEFETGMELIRPVETLQGKSRTWVINVFFQVTTKLNAYSTRRDQGIDRDYTDLSFLIQTYTDQIRSFQGYLNLEHCDLFIQDAILEESQQMSEWYALVLKDSQVEGEDGALAAV
ncbi:hypothetical protein MCOR16_001758 [Pyricularia oryzae]|nr:hypothetical protein MCOR16_001758 [Pyricularia oryzae]